MRGPRLPAATRPSTSIWSIRKLVFRSAAAIPRQPARSATRGRRLHSLVCPIARLSSCAETCSASPDFPTRWRTSSSTSCSRRAMASSASIGTSAPNDDPDWDTLVFAEHWWTEATAEWAAFHFTRDMPWQDDARLTGHLARFSYFLDRSPSIPLHAPQQRGETGWAFMYSTYIWFYFMEQEVGSEAIAEIWEAFGEFDPGTVEQAMAIIDAQLPFAEHFRDFAVRNLNLKLEPGDPIDPDYGDLDPQFPIGEISPPVLVGAEDAEAWLPIAAENEEPRRFADHLRSLTAHYYRFLPDPRGGMLVLDFSGLAPVGDLD